MNRLVIANRGEIARRILRAARDRGWQIAVVSVASDSDAVVRREADEVLEVPSFLDAEAVVAAAADWGAGFLHPGYGFLSEDARFAEFVEKAGIVFVGPTPENMRTLGPKEPAKRFASQCDVPTLPSLWSDELPLLEPHSLERLFHERGLVAPFLVKASAGGGGRGLRVADTVSSLWELMERARGEAKAGFSDGRVFIEQYLKESRHIEVQIFGDGQGRVVALGDRECSIQRRYQKIVEEAPAPHLDDAVRKALVRSALAIAGRAAYRGAGTVEFLVEPNGRFYFLEVNTRIQVEHTVTEKVMSIDLVQAQFDLAEGIWPRELDAAAARGPAGSALEVRVVAEDPRHDFRPTPGRLVRYREPSIPSVRVDSGVVERSRVNPDFDSLVAKVIAFGVNREAARQRLLSALENTVIHGCRTNLNFLSSIVTHRDFVSGRLHTRWLEEHLAELSRPHLPSSLIDLMSSEGFCEQLSLALCGGLPRRSRLFAEKFLSLGNSYLRVGSMKEELPWVIEAIDLNDGLFEVRGRAVAAALLNARENLAGGSGALRRLYAEATQLPENSAVRFVATRVSQTEIAVTCLGETFEVSSPRHRVWAVNGVSAGREIKAPLAGKVAQVCVKPGDKVSSGSLLFVLESMKMLFDIRAEMDGIVDTVTVGAGQVLTGPCVLATLAPE